MSTRGILGYVSNGKRVAAYNHSDSYPKGGLGEDVARAMKKLINRDSLATIKANVDAIQLVEEGVPPTKKQIAECKKRGIADFGVSSGSEDDWYCLLRGVQGNVEAMLTGKTPYIENYIDFLEDSLSCEYGYLFNFDTNKLEFYSSGKLATEFDMINDLTVKAMVSAMEAAE